MTTENLLKAIQALLETTAATVYQEQADDGAVMPYLVWNGRGTSDPQGGRIDMVLEVDAWDDKGNDTAAVEALADRVDTVLSRARLVGDGLQGAIYRLNPYRIPVPDPDPQLRRRRCRYIVRAYSV